MSSISDLKLTKGYLYNRTVSVKSEGRVRNGMRTSVNNVVVFHLFPGSSGFLFVDPVGLEPMIMRHQTEVNLSRNNVGDTSI